MAAAAAELVIGWCIFGLLLLAILAFCWVYVRKYQSQRESEVVSTVTAIFSLAVALITSALLPVDIFLVSYMKNQNGTFKDWADANVTVQIENTVLYGYYTLYSVILFCVFFWIPFVYFYYEEKDEDDASKCTQIKTALKYTLGFVVICALLLLVGHSYTGQNYSTQKNTGKISLDQIDSLSTKSFPPCMRQLHKALRENHHLRHGGRMQYGLFLKGIGLTLEQALQFWKQEFIRGKMDPDKFDKGYSYNIRHSFGKEGKRTDYTPFSCMKIILTNPPGQGDYHGCPFRHSDAELLKQKMQSYKIPASGISQILDLVKGNHYQVACQKYFEMTHNVDDCGFSLNHPNQFFFESQRILTGGKDIKKEISQPETPQHKPSTQKTRDAASALASLDSSLEMDLEGLEEYF